MFKDTKFEAKYIDFLKSALTDEEFKEMAIPSYTHRISLIRWLFNKRLETILSFNYSNKTVLDYGTGSGILLPALSSQGCPKIYAADINIKPVTKLVAHFDWKNYHGKKLVHIVKVNRENNAFELKDDLDVVIAADVLEHVDHLEELIERFAKLLSDKDGYLIISGPTENWMYKIGRMVAGFKNDYHVRNIQDIKKIILESKHFDLVGREVLPFSFIPGFEILLFKYVSDNKGGSVKFPSFWDNLFGDD